MKIIFAGTGMFAVPSLEALVHFCQQMVGYELLGVYTQPDRPFGRGRSALVKGPVKQCAESHQLLLHQPHTLKDVSSQTLLGQMAPDLLIVADYGLILPRSVLGIPRRGCVNVHASLLPRWRGAAPVQHAILAGDHLTGITIMQMAAGLDTGPIFQQMKEPIRGSDTTEGLEARLAKLGAKALINTILSIANDTIRPYAQPKEGACYANKLLKADGLIDWSLSATQIHRQIRAFNPWPISFSWLEGEKIRVWEASLEDARPTLQTVPGTIVSITQHEIVVATGQGALRLKRLQKEGGRCLEVRDLLNGALSSLSVGMRFGNLT